MKLTRRIYVEIACVVLGAIGITYFVPIVTTNTENFNRSMEGLIDSGYSITDDNFVRDRSLRPEDQFYALQDHMNQQQFEQLEKQYDETVYQFVSAVMWLGIPIASAAVAITMVPIARILIPSEPEQGAWRR